MEKTNVITAGVILILLLGAGYYVYDHLPSSTSGTKPASSQQGESDVKDKEEQMGETQKSAGENEMSGELKISLEGADAGGGPSVEVGRVSPEDVSASAVASIPVPDLTREIKLYNDETFPEKQKTEIFGRIKELAGVLGENNGYFEGWHELGALRKAIGDYEGARDAWEYAAALRPRSSVPFASLAHLYAYYFRDYARAEANYLHAIEEEPTAAFLYGQAAEFYLDIMGDKEKAIGILEQGAEALPNNTLIPQAIEELQAE